MLEFIEYPKCSTCKKAKQELNQLGVDYKGVHIVEETPSQEVILNWLETSGFELKQFFNTSGIKDRTQAKQLAIRNQLHQVLVPI